MYLHLLIPWKETTKIIYANFLNIRFTANSYLYIDCIEFGVSPKDLDNNNA